MNRIFKIIWNETKHTYVVASELAKNHCHASSSSLAKLAAGVVTVGALTGSVGILPAYAVNEDTTTRSVTFGGGTIEFELEQYGKKYKNSFAGPTTASGLNSTAFGYNTTARGDGALAFGGVGAYLKYNKDTRKYDMVLYDPNEASGDNAVAFGLQTKATGNQATAFGFDNTASGENATAWGNSNTASGKNATAWGNESTATAKNATAWGLYSEAKAENATAWGDHTHASGKYSTSFGTNTFAYGEAATAWGYEHTKAVGDDSTAWGELNIAYGENSTAFGERSHAYGENSTAFGYYSYAYGENSLALLGAITGEIGDKTSYKYANGDDIYELSGGANAMAVGMDAHAQLDDSIALGSRAVANREAGSVGYDISDADHSTDTSGTWISTENAVAVGDAENKVTRQITGVAAGLADTDAVNVAQLKKVADMIDAGGAGNDTHIQAGTYNVQNNQVSMDIVDKDGNVKGNVTITDIASKTELDAVSNRVDEIDGRVTTIEGDIKNIKGDITNIQETAKKHSSVSTQDSNVVIEKGTNAEGGKDYQISLNKDQVLDSVTTGDTKMNTDGVTVGDKVTLNKDGLKVGDTVVNNNGLTAGDTVVNNDGLKVGDNVSVTNNAVTAGNTSISNEGLKVDNKTYVSKDGINANSQKITNVADGEVSATSKDAVNGSQLHATNEQVQNNSNRINKLGNRINKVGAGAAALAALHPMDFDPDDKWSFAAGYGNYAGQNAAALGAYYRPDEKVMFSVGGTVGNGENMVNAGVSFALDRTNHVSNSRTAMAREILDLRAEVAELKAMVARGGLGSIDEDKQKLFPDIPENHWAYEYIAKLAGNGILEGYPDGNFSGDRMMSRYEFAAMLYRAMQKGAQLDSKIINEFAPEMGRIRVDRISGKDNERGKIERVRVNYGDDNDKRDHYGSKIIPVNN